MTDATLTDLRRAPLADARATSFRSGSRDLWADEAAIHDRLQASWAGLDDAAWHVPGAAPSDAGGPDWSLADHVGHLVLWQEEASRYTARAIETDTWPTDADYDGGDFDRFNERNRAPWTTMARDEILARFAISRRELAAQVQRLTGERIRRDDAWDWILMSLHGHYLDHLGIVEAWTDALRIRQNDGDPFVDDPRPADFAGLVAQDAIVAADVDRLIRTVPAEDWDTDELTPGWTLRDHVAHLGDWAEEGIRAIDVYRRRGHWPADPEEGLDAWNQRMVERTRGSSKADTLARYDALHAELLVAISEMSSDELRSADGWAWTYDCLHGHARKHLALVGPWCVERTWPAEALR